MKKLKKLLALTVLTAISLTTFNCTKDDTKVNFTVTFDADNGDEVKSIEVVEGEKVTKPTNPMKKRYRFIEWRDGDNKFDFNTTITKDITLKAIWELTISSDNNWEIKVNEKGNITIIKYKGTDTEVIIPENIDGKSVDSIEGSIGGGIFIDSPNVTSVDMSKVINLKTIGDYAFRHFSSLVSITLPNGVNSIGRNAFEGCNELKSIIIPNGVISIGKYAFSNCSSLNSIIIPDGVISIGEKAFNYCSILPIINIPNSVTSIGDGAFDGCRFLNEITLPASFKDKDISGLNL